MAGLELGGGRVVLAGLAGVLLLSDDGGRTFRSRSWSDRKGHVALPARRPASSSRRGRRPVFWRPDR